jgi:hypothetical protein
MRSDVPEIRPLAKADRVGNTLVGLEAMTQRNEPPPFSSQ